MSDSIMLGSSTSSDAPLAGGYRIKFNRDEFLRLVSEAKPRRVYKVRNFVFFAYDGFVMYCDQLNQQDLLRFEIYEAIEFSNVSWKRV